MKRAFIILALLSSAFAQNPKPIATNLLRIGYEWRAQNLHVTEMSGKLRLTDQEKSAIQSQREQINNSYSAQARNLIVKLNPFRKQLLQQVTSIEDDNRAATLFANVNLGPNDAIFAGRYISTLIQRAEH